VRAGVLSAIADLGLTVAGPGWQSSHVPGATVIEGGIYGERMFQAFSLADICVNIHQNFGGPIDTYGTGLNSRVFEVTGCGGLLLTDRKRDLDELFTEDREVTCYSSRAELRERVEELLNDVPRARSVAEAGRLRTIGCHTLHHRFRSMIAEVGRLGSAA
jgi:spore maturation protein CgeB